MAKLNKKEHLESTQDSKPKNINHIECTACGTQGVPYKCDYRHLVAIFGLFVGVVPCLYILALTNPYICKNCKQRHSLIKVLNDGTSK